MLVDGSMVPEGKPNPGIYMKAAQLLNVKPENCLVFEDSFFGIESALSAGMKVVAITTSHDKNSLSGFSCREIIHDFSYIKAKEIESMLHNE